MTGIGLWCGLVLYLPNGRLPGITRSLGSELFVAAGVLRLGCWHSTRAIAELRAAVGFIGIGALIPALVTFTAWTADGTQPRPTEHLARLIVFAPILLILAPLSLRSAHRPALSRTAVVVLLATLAAFGLILGLPHVPVPPAELRALSIAIEAGLAYGWVALAIHAKRSGTRSALWTAAAMLVLGVGSTLRAVSFALPVGVLAVQPVFTLVAGALVTGAAAVDLALALRSDAERRRAMSRSLLETRQVLARAEQDERERLHDARSAVFGVIGASQLLAREPAPIDRALLQQLIASELNRLRTVLDTASVEAVVDFDIAETLEPVVLAHRLEQPTICARIEALRVTGRPGTIATVLDNLVRNARTHASGARITIRTEREEGAVALIVEDDGPGIPAAERTTVVLPGVRGSTARGHGSGLGLANCVRVLADQHGELRIEAPEGGGTRIVATLPAADPDLTARSGPAEVPSATETVLAG